MESIRGYDDWKLSGPPELTDAEEAFYDQIDKAIAALEKLRDGNGTLAAARDAVEGIVEPET